jgi:hypothetical protein
VDRRILIDKRFYCPLKEEENSEYISWIAPTWYSNTRNNTVDASVIHVNEDYNKDNAYNFSWIHLKDVFYSVY